MSRPRLLHTLTLMATLVLLMTACSQPDTETVAEGPGEDPATDETEAEPADDGETEPDEDVEPEFVLEWTTHVGPESTLSLQAQAWQDRVVELTGGRVDFNVHYLQSLCSIAESLECAADGRADIASTTVGFFPGDFPLGDVSSIPFVTRNGPAQLQTFSEMYRTHEDFAAEHERQGVHVLYWAVTSPATLGTDESVDYEWLEGKQIRGVGRMVDALDIAGANPVALPVSEVFEAMQRGTVDAWFAIPLEPAVLDFSLHEVSNTLASTGSGIFISGHSAINLDRWNSLPDDIKEAMNQAGAEVEERWAEFEEGAALDACERINEHGAQVELWPEEETEKWRQAIGDTIMLQWAEEARERGADDPEGFFREYESLLRQYEAEIDYQTPAELCVANS